MLRNAERKIPLGRTMCVRNAFRVHFTFFSKFVNIFTACCSGAPKVKEKFEVAFFLLQFFFRNMN